MRLLKGLEGKWKDLRTCVLNCWPTPGVSCAAGRRLEGGGRRAEAAARQCACGRPVERQERWVVAVVLRLRVVVTPIGRSGLPGESRPAHEPRQRCPLHALVGEHGKTIDTYTLVTVFRRVRMRFTVMSFTTPRVRSANDCESVSILSTRTVPGRLRCPSAKSLFDMVQRECAQRRSGSALST